MFGAGGILLLLDTFLYSASASRVAKTESVAHHPPLDLLVNGLVTALPTRFAGYDVDVGAMYRWQKERLLSSDNLAGYLACATYGHGGEAHELLKESLSILETFTVCNDKMYGACFVVTLNPIEAQTMLDDPSAFHLSSIWPIPPFLKLSPGLLEYRPGEAVGNQTAGSDGTHEEQIETWDLTGLTIRTSPGCLKIHDASADALVEDWYAEMDSESTGKDMSSFWSDPEILGVASDPNGGVFGQEWREAAELLQNLSETEGRSICEICKWDEIELHPADDDVIIVTALDYLLHGNGDSEVRTACFVGLLSHFAAKPEVLRISSLSAGRLLNHVGNAIVQSGNIYSTPLSDAGLDGTGEVIQMIDSGVDETSCFFMDEDGLEVEHGSYYTGYLDSRNNRHLVRSSSDAYLVDLSRRKVVQYMELFKTPDSSQTSVYSDSFYYYSEIYEPIANSTARYDQDVPDGHGTHTAGTAAGAMVVDHLEVCPAGQVSGCVGKCLTIEEAMEPRGSGAFDLDARCPAFGCAAGNGSEVASSCLSNDPTQNVEQSGGVARGAKLAVFDVSGGGRWRSMEVGNDLWAVSAETGAKVHSNSWGMVDTWCAFSEWDVQYDTFMYENPEHLLVFAAGNDGGLKDTPADDPGCTVVSPGLGKNTLTVGATSAGPTRSPLTGADGRLRYDEKGMSGYNAQGEPHILMDPKLGLPSASDEGADIDTVAYFSAYGPTKDGRIKPEVVAPGDRVYSASSDGSDSYSCAITEMHGTSTACPMAAGSAALVRQYFTDPMFYAHDVEARALCGGSSNFTCAAFSPSAATVKAVLINSADLMGGSAEPDVFRGFGRIHLDEGMPMGGHGEATLFVADALSTSIVQDATDVYTFDVNATAGRDFRATLSWIDPPSTTFTTRHLLHDLDLVVMDPNGTAHRMWGDVPDTVNVNERIIVPAEKVLNGSWTVEVSVQALTTPSQSYSLVVNGALMGN